MGEEDPSGLDGQCCRTHGRSVGLMIKKVATSCLCLPLVRTKRHKQVKTLDRGIWVNRLRNISRDIHHNEGKNPIGLVVFL